jgi:hypothetical protein
MANNQCLRYIKNLCTTIIFLIQLIFIVILTYVIYPLINMEINERMSVILCCVIQILFTIGSISIYCKVLNFINRYNTNNNTYNRL